MRLSSKALVDVTEMVLCESLNNDISSAICFAGGRAVGLSGRDEHQKKISKMSLIWICWEGLDR